MQTQRIKFNWQSSLHTHTTRKKHHSGGALLHDIDAMFCEFLLIFFIDSDSHKHTHTMAIVAFFAIFF